MCNTNNNNNKKKKERKKRETIDFQSYSSYIYIVTAITLKLKMYVEGELL
jgi:hypothetical protein